MKSLTKFLFAAVMLAGFNSAFAETQDRHLSGFHAISESGSFDIYITQGATESVRVEAPSDIINKIITEVSGDVLKIHEKSDHFNWGNIFNGGHKKIAVYIVVKDIHAISLSGSGDAFFKEGLSADRLELKTSGSGDMLGKVNVKTLETGISGSGDIKLSGSAETSTISTNGSGDFSGRDLVTATTMVRISGSGDASVNATQKLDARVSGSGDIRYTGGAKQISSHSSGSGDIHRF
ncbi:MAG: head GIN domain-containing protein [Bacteroidota bacterium]